MAPLTRRAALLGLLMAGTAPALGAEAVRVVDAAGVESDLAALTAGRPAVLHLWATWCAPCVEELPRLAAMREANPDLAEGIVIVSVDSAPYERVAAFLQERLSLSLPTLKVVAGNPGLAYGLMGYPSTLLLAPDGTILDRETGSLDWTSPAVVARLRAHLGADGRH